MKLSKTQRNALEMMAEVDGFLHYMENLGRRGARPDYFPHGHIGMHVRVSTVDALVRHGYAERYNQNSLNNDHRIRITPAGRAALSEGGEKR